MGSALQCQQPPRTTLAAADAKKAMDAALGLQQALKPAAWPPAEEPTAR